MSQRDARGLPLSTTAAAAGHYRAGVDAWLRVQDGFAASMAAALAEDPGFALAAAGLALDAVMRGEKQAAAGFLRTARLAAEGATDRERRHVAAVGARVQQPLHGAVRDMTAHVRRYPRDALVFSATMGTVLYSGLPNLTDRLIALCAEGHSAYGRDDWWWLGTEAFWLQEQGRLDESAALAERALALDARAGWAAHARAHVDDRTGNAATGIDWLDTWLAGGPMTAVLAGHLHWHAALHELAGGDTAAALRRFRAGIAPTTHNPGNAVVDASSLLWRFSLRRIRQPPAEALRPLVDQVAAAPAFAFAGLHAGLAYAAAADPAALRRLGEVVRRDARPAFADVCAPVLDALLAFAEGRYAECAAGLGQLHPATLAQLGGSIVQREVLEDTRIEALLRAEDISAAQPALARALERRPG